MRYSLRHRGLACTAIVLLLATIGSASDGKLAPEPPRIENTLLGVPANDECADATPVAVPSTTPGSTVGAAADPQVPFCGDAVSTGPAVWFSLVGTGNALFVSTCGSADFDTQITVICPDCQTPTCVAGNDDGLGCDLFTSELEFDSVAGEEYLVLVHGFAQFSGDFTLIVNDTGIPGSNPVDCCIDLDGDGVCATEDCNDANPNCTSDCTDADGDGLCVTTDCDDTNAFCTVDCTDADSDGVCANKDCDESEATCTLDCTDADSDGLAACAGDCDEANPNCLADCTDLDGDGFCVETDCDDTAPLCNLTCDDSDGDGLNACNDCDDTNQWCTVDCLDTDADGFCVTFDCDDAKPACTTDCTDVDADGFCIPQDCDDTNENCTADCTDADGDGICVVEDCDDSNTACGTDCTDADSDGFPACADCDDTRPGCSTDCTDADGDGICVTDDCDESDPTCGVDCSDFDLDGVNGCADCGFTFSTCAADCTDADLNGVPDCDDGAVPRLYVTSTLDGGSIRVSDLDVLAFTPVFTKIGYPDGLKVDIGARKMYWTDEIQQSVFRANLDGTGFVEIISGPLPKDVDLDGLAGKLYWVNLNGSVNRSNPDGTGIEFLITPVSVPRRLFVDPVHGRLYHGGGAGGSVQLYRATLDGADNQLLVNVPATQLPGGLDADPYEGKIYWNAGNRVWRWNLDGTGEESRFFGVYETRGLALDPVAGHVYVAHYIPGGGGTTRVTRLPLDLSDETVVFEADGDLGFAGLEIVRDCGDVDGDGVTVCEGDCDDTNPSCTTDCTDADGDGFCVTTDCDDSNSNCTTDCTDGDGDGFCAPQDCDDGDADCATSCDDLDGDGLTLCDGDCDDSTALCTTDCTDADGDGYCITVDCDDAAPNCTTDCADADNDGFCITVDCDDTQVGCTTDCTDADGDGLTVCAGDCDDASPSCTIYCGDADADGVRACDGDCDEGNPNCTTDCTDADGDGYCVTEDCLDTDASCATNCIDEDGDGVVCNADCDPNNPHCGLDCTDLDGDGYCVDQDCEDTNPACNASCADDDGDGVRGCDGDCNDMNPNCTATCTDNDGDDYCVDRDCDDQDSLCNTDCNDGDGDGLAVCKGDCDDTNPNCTTLCSDPDGDGFCILADCDEFNPFCNADCTDIDGDGYCQSTDCDPLLTSCNASCIDADGDGTPVCAGDCDDANPNCSATCVDGDSDGFCIDQDCDDTNGLCAADCGDGDGDGLTVCEGDCDNTVAACTLDCTDADADGLAACAGDCDESNPSCTTDCTDADGDGFCVTADCDDANATCTDDCTDADADGFCAESDCDDLNPSCNADCTDGDADGFCVTDDCNDADPNCRADCTDTDGDGFCIGIDCDDTNDTCTEDCTDADGDGFCAESDCLDTASNVYPGAPEICTDGFDTDCDGVEDDLDPPCPGLVVDALRFLDPGTLSWDPATGAVGYALYRGSIPQRGFGDFDHLCEATELAVPGARDDDEPAPGEGFYYLAGGLDADYRVSLGSGSPTGARPDSDTIPCGARVHVDPDLLLDEGDGLSWATAYTTVTAALTHAAGPARGVEIWIRGNPDRNASFTPVRRPGARLLGGFAGTETLAWDRDPATTPSVWLGDGPLPVLTASGGSLVLDGMTLRNAGPALQLRGRGNRFELMDIRFESITGWGLDLVVERDGEIDVQRSTNDGSGEGVIRVIARAGLVDGRIRANTFLGGTDSAIRLEARGSHEVDLGIDVVANEISGGSRGIVLGAHGDDSTRSSLQTSFIASNWIYGTSQASVLVEAAGDYVSRFMDNEVVATPLLNGNTFSDGNAGALVTSATRADVTGFESRHEVRAEPAFWNNLVTFYAGTAVVESADDEPAELRADPELVANNFFSVGDLLLDEGTTPIFTIPDLNALEQASDNMESDPAYVDRPSSDYHIRFGTLIGLGDLMRYLANDSDPVLGTLWTAEIFDDSLWPSGIYGVGYETGTPPNAEQLLRTEVPGASLSVYTRILFNIDDLADVDTLVLGVDYDDGFVAWINGVEVARSLSMPAGDPSWDTQAGEHESSNAPAPVFEETDISIVGIPVLQEGANVLAIGVWNAAPPSDDLVLVPQLVVNDEYDVVDAGRIDETRRMATEDIDGESRNLDGDRDGRPQPDIGADERR